MAKKTGPVACDYIQEPLRHLAVPIDSVHPDPANARLHGEENLAAIVASLKAFGQDQPLVVQKKGRIVRKGNGRLLAAQKLGWSHVAAVIVDEEDVQAVARAIADNRTSELASWDETVLGSLLSTLRNDAPQLAAATGFSDEQIDKLLAKNGDADKDKNVELPPTKFEIVVECEGEAEQRELYERLQAEGKKCRVLTF